MDTPRVLHLFESRVDDYTSRRVSTLATRLRDARAYDVAITSVDRLRDTGARPAAIGIFGRLAAQLRETSVNILHCHGLPSTLFGLLAARWVGDVKVVADGVGQDSSYLSRLAHRASQSIIVSSSEARRVLIEVGLSPERVSVIHRTTDPGRFERPVGFMRERALEALGLPLAGSKRYITTIAGSSPESDVETFIRAACRVAIDSTATAFVIAGRGRPKPKLQSFAKRFNLENRIHFVETADHMAELLAISSIGVHTSRTSEPVGGVLDYMSARLPVIAATGDASDVVVEGLTGHLVPPGDDRMLAERMSWLLADEYRARLMGAHGRRIVLEHFSEDTYGDSIRQVYDRLLGIEHPAPLVRRTAA